MPVQPNPQLPQPAEASASGTATIGVAALSLAATAGLVPWLDKSLFRDDGATLYSARLPWADLWRQARHVDLVLTPYYAFMHLWVAVSESVAWARLPSLVSYGATVFLAGRLGGRLGGRWCALVAAACTAANPVAIATALQVRPYAVAALGSMLCALLLCNWLDDHRPKWLWAFGALSVVVALIQVFALLAPLSMIVAILVVRPSLVRARLRAMVVPLGVAIVLAGTWAVVTAAQSGQVDWIAGTPKGQYLLSEAKGPAGVGVFPVLMAAVALILLLRLIATWDSGGRSAVAEVLGTDRDRVAVIAGWAALPTVALAVVSVVHPIFVDRYVDASVPGLALLVALLWSRLWWREPAARTRHRRAWTCAGALAVAALAAAFVTRAPVISEDLKGLAADVAGNARPGDRLALPDHALTAAVTSYLGRDQRIVPEWPQLGTRQPYIEGLDLVLGHAERGASRVWLVDDGSLSTTSFVRMLGHDHYAQARVRQFAGVTLTLYRRTS